MRPTARPAGLVRRQAPGAESLIAKAKLGGEVAYVVADARSGTILEARNGDMALPPASVTKAITALYALDRMGMGYRFRTRLLATGPIAGGKLEGDLILAGGGDPTLDTDHLMGLAAQLKAAGVHEVTGKLRVYDGALPTLEAIEPDQPEHVGYNPAVSGLNLNFNRVHFEWKRAAQGYAITMQARALKHRPDVNLTRMRIADRGAPVYTYDRNGKTEDWSVARGALGKEGGRWLPVRQPGLYAAEVFETLARSHGIVLRRGPKATHVHGQVIAEHLSPPMPEMLRAMLKYSTNLTAEVMGLMATRQAGSNPGSLEASARTMNSWLHRFCGAETSKFVDHSGLGSGAKVAPTELVKALVRAGPDGQLRGLMKPAYLQNERGAPIKDGPVDIRAKTGTLNFVSALSGYLRNGQGRHMAFAILTADEPRRAALSVEERERPSGGKSWSKRSRRLQAQLLDRWSTLYGA
ncbi:D-alanyl-D-alanine carboxypeptidase [Actibacterium pelagium]|uniref:D-alanyl-D-alanine carboxypeptidase n=1 Tax=Actibacterium pelagium TaxID=2029103 RepID=A0A917EKP7_9RHOB|nr:D-alanyl-D-alanine carboxypeptidase [Actibacterium pelagium]